MIIFVKRCHVAAAWRRYAEVDFDPAFHREQHLMKPVIALVGRPNVGKSTLFNRLTRSRDALVADLPGLTRDRHYGEGRIGERPYLVVDTGGFEPVAKDGILHEMARQTRQAVEEADIVVFIVDGRNGLAPQDKSIADYLRKVGRPIFLVVNKAEGMKYSAVAADFYELGLGDPRAISAAHGDGVTEMINEALDVAYAGQPEESDDEKQARRREDRDRRPPECRQVDADQYAGRRRARDRVRHAGHHPRFDLRRFRAQGKPYTLIDTAGLRRRGKVFEAIEKFSVVKTLQSISDANVVILLLDAQPGHLRAGRAHRRFRRGAGARAGGGREQMGRSRSACARANQSGPRRAS